MEQSLKTVRTIMTTCNNTKAKGGRWGGRTVGKIAPENLPFPPGVQVVKVYTVRAPGAAVYTRE